MHDKKDDFKILISKQKEKLNYDDIQLLKNIKFVSLAEIGAMGSPGEIQMISRIDNANVLYSGNLFFGNVIIDMKKIKSLFPDISFMHCLLMQCDYNPVGWRYLNLGAGNNLYVSEDIYEYFDILTNGMRGANLYVSWKQLALATITLLAKGYKNKYKFKEYYEKHIEEKDLKPILVNLNTKKIMAEGIKNSIISFVAGDMIGTPVQFILRKNLQKDLEKYSIKNIIENIRNKNLPFGVWSDDSSMTLCTMKSIVEKQEIDIENIGNIFLKWLYDNYMTPLNKTFDVGRTTFAALNNFKNNPKTQSGMTDINSNGNGSLMRILPVSFYCYFKKFSNEQTFQTIKNVSSITHAHPISILGCYIYTLIIFDILNGLKKDNIIKNLADIKKQIPKEYKKYLCEYSRIIDGSIINEQIQNIKTTGYVRYTLEVALWGFYNTQSTEDCIFEIVKLGHDSDTNGAVGGSLSGLYYGLRNKNIKKYWIDKIIKKDEICNMIDEYINVLNLEGNL